MCVHKKKLAINNIDKIKYTSVLNRSFMVSFFFQNYGCYKSNTLRACLFDFKGKKPTVTKELLNVTIIFCRKIRLICAFLFCLTVIKIIKGCGQGYALKFYSF